MRQRQQGSEGPVRLPGRVGDGRRVEQQRFGDGRGRRGEVVGGGGLGVAVTVDIGVSVGAGSVATTCVSVAVAVVETAAGVSIVSASIAADVGSLVITAGEVQPTRVRSNSN